MDIIHLRSLKFNARVFEIAYFTQNWEGQEYLG